MRNAFADCLNLWVTTPPYCDFPSKTIGWRLVPAFKHGRFKVWYDNNGLCTGFVTWAWMTDSEFETRKYTGSEVFARNYSDKLVFVDMIAINGVSDVLSMSRDLRRFFRKTVPRGKNSMVTPWPTKRMVSKQRWLDMIDLLNRIGFRQIAFGGESSGGSGGGSGSGRTVVAPMKH
jgi:hemolysin-activating ACP:hemolysin acyltransferase